MTLALFRRSRSKAERYTYCLINGYHYANIVTTKNKTFMLVSGMRLDHTFAAKTEAKRVALTQIMQRREII